MGNDNKITKRRHDAYFRWLFADTAHVRYLLELAGKINHDIYTFLTQVNLDTLMRIPDSYSEVDDTGEADLAFRVNVSTGAPILVGILLEHKSGRDPAIFDQISKYIHSVMKIQDKSRMFSGIPTMAIIFYNGRDSWNPLRSLEKAYPDYFRGKVLPFQCAFVNMADIPDSDCLACEDTATGMGIIALKHAFNKDKLLELLPRFCKFLQKMPRSEASCLLGKTSIYLQEYLGKDFLKELDMAFVSIGQKYGFVSIGDYLREQMADERQELAELRQLAANDQQRLEETRQQVENIRQQVTEAQQRLEETRQQVTGAQQRLEETRQQVTEDQQRLEETRQQVTGAQQRLEETRQQVTEDQQRLEETRQQVEELRHQAAEERQQVEEARQQIAEEQRQLEEKRQQFVKERQQFEEERRKLTKE
ncbi:Rpn family recombination-promoting nuclease/putative transposase [Fibrobacter sp.]|uniref:Rpn family recombination-promoting nuclease/putative transposase n=1 Tax=Fibrobacter sp. TaxID=35828 RepID=UPI0025BAD108|nr:Rpn family recombination-promoting nuclease/putative transposase [Fibrobacter sp.]MBR3070916.1 Rpn family recombination-promoting nuclease/putative transposase [Fibrobacter sp.]